jgi:zinc/manganese transport system permease protein
MNLDGLDLGILGPAFLAGLLVLATHVPLGMRVLDKGIVFIDLAIAQVAGIGVIAADALGWEPEGWAVQVSAVGAALLGALVLNWSEKRWPEIQEALIGVLFVLASSAAILLLAGNPHGGEHLKDLLVGQILWVTPTQLLPVAVLSAAVLALWFGVGRRLGRLGFYGLFAVSVTASVQLVGVYLVFTSLIVPALATRRLTMPRRLVLAYSLGAVGYAFGLALSALFDLPSGAVVVLVMAAVAVLVAVPWHGLQPASPAANEGAVRRESEDRHA